MPSSVRNLVALLAFVVVCIPSTARAVCGDGMVDPDEECEPTDLLGLGCVDFGFAGGLIGCTSECRFDLRACTNCGNALVDADEQCDGANLGGLTCADLGFTDGDLACERCEFDADGCFGDPREVCGDGVRLGDEECDGDDLSLLTCASLGFDGGELGCDSECTFDAAACFGCGDGDLNPGEVCDGEVPAELSCETEGFVGGEIACRADCRLDLTACSLCGNGEVDLREECDGEELDGATCADFDFDGGELACDTQCLYDLSGCLQDTCGDGIADVGEECDGDDVSGETCESLGYRLGGTLGCTRACTYDVDGCDGIVARNCGNEVAERSEECDRSDFRGLTCADFGFEAGELICNARCTIETGLCTESGIDRPDVGGVLDVGSTDAGQDAPSGPYEDVWVTADPNPEVPDLSIGCCGPSSVADTRGRATMGLFVIGLLVVGRRRIDGH